MKKKIKSAVISIVVIAVLLLAILICRNVFLTFPILQAFQSIH